MRYREQIVPGIEVRTEGERIVIKATTYTWGADDITELHLYPNNVQELIAKLEKALDETPST